MVRRILAATLALLLALGGAAADEGWVPKGWRVISPGGPDLPAPARDTLAAKQVLRFNNGAEPGSLDPHLMIGVPEHTIARGLYEGLTLPHPKTGMPIPGLAEAWAVSPDGMKFRFRIRAGIKFSNGAAIDARTFVSSWRRVLDPKTAAQYAYELYPVKGAEAFNKGKADTFDGVGARAVDPRVFEVELTKPTPYFVQLTSSATYAPVHLPTIAKHGAGWTQPGKLVCSGPFVLAEWKPRSRIVLVPNPHYWDARRVSLRRIEIHPIDDQNTAMNKYLAEELDWIGQVPTRRLGEAKKHPDYYVQPYLATYYYVFNTTKKPFDDRLVRRAFSLATDRVRLCRDVLKAGQVPAYRLVPPGLHGYSGSKGGGKYDPAAARKLMADAGHPEGKGLGEIELTYNTSEDHKLVAETLSEMWRKALGVKVRLRNMEWKVFLDQVKKLRYQVARYGWLGNYSDPNTFLDMFVTRGKSNNTGWSNTSYDKLISQAARTLDVQKRMAVFLQAESLLVDHLPILPLYHYVKQGFRSPAIGGWYENVLDTHPFQFLYMKADE